MAGVENDPEKLRAYTAAAWVFLLHAAGVEAGDEAIRDACVAIAKAGDAVQGEASALALVDALSGRLSDDLGAAVQDLYPGRARLDMGEGDRDARNRRIRMYVFETGLPWLARICRRRDDGVVAASWVVVERFGNAVTLMDPNPWDDVDETVVLPLGDFHFLWELAGKPSVHLA